MTDKERIEIYINELPENCMECPFSSDAISCDDYCVCGAVKNGMCQSYEQAKNKEDCPLKTIQSVQNAKAVEALEKARKIFLNATFFGDIEITDDIKYVAQQIDNLIKEYGGKDASTN